MGPYAVSRHTIAVVLVVVNVSVTSTDASAQRVPPRLRVSTPLTTWRGRGAPGQSVAPVDDPYADRDVRQAQPTASPPRRPQHAAPYIVVGAAVGAAATAGGILYYFRQALRANAFAAR